MPYFPFFSISEILIFRTTNSNPDPDMILLWYEGIPNKGWNHSADELSQNI